MATIYDINSYRRLNNAANKQELDFSGYMHQQKFMGRIPEEKNTDNSGIEKIIEESLIKEQRKKIVVVGTLILSIGTLIGMLGYYYGGNHDANTGATAENQGASEAHTKKYSSGYTAR